ncbi:MAG: hypothetical protein Q9160_006549 [Pyrenula sp. 1 TL-2023]
MMHGICFVVLLLPFSSFAIDTSDVEYIAPGRAGRIVKRAPRDFGTFDVPCTNAESACNNACYYIKCNANNDPNANKVTYIGPNGNNKEDTTNRQESGCTAAQGGSVCGNYPFSQVWIDDQSKATLYDCDEWPPASSQQVAFNNKQNKNSLRCMPKGENRSLGSKLGNFYNDQGGPYPGRLITGPMARGDFVRVTFNTNGANQAKLGFCLSQGTVGCGNDGYQFGMTSKPVNAGKISARYEPSDNNRYSTQQTVYADLFQCSVELTRDGDNDFKDFKVFNWENKDTTDPKVKSCTISSGTGQCDMKGLPNNLVLKKTGAFGTVLNFEYATTGNVNHFTWNSEQKGNGKGPVNKDGEILRYCAADKTSNSEQKFNCWFPCYKNADGK